MANDFQIGDYTPKEYREWQVPPAAVRDSYKIGWANEATEEGLAWLKSQRGYSDFRKALDVFAGKDSIRTSAAYRSGLNTNRLKSNARTVVGALAKLKPMWGYHSDNATFKDRAEMFNKVTRAWYLESMADRRIREALQYGAATCRGWAHPIYKRAMYGTGQGDLIIETYGSPSVLPNQLPANGNWQEAYACQILKELPVAMAHGMFPRYQDKLRPSSSRYWYANDGVRKANQGNLLQRMFGRVTRNNAVDALTELLVPMRYIWIIDLAINTTTTPILMGDAGSSWAYTVPYYGQKLPDGRTANETDARLYPYRRLMIVSDNCVPYDGPAFDWHGMFPGVSFCTDDYPWEPLGFSLMHDGYEINDAIKEIKRGNMDKIRAQLRPSYAYDMNAVSSREAKSFDPFQPDARMGYDGTNSEQPPFHQAMDAESLKVQPESMAMIEMLNKDMDTQLGVREAYALAQIRTVGSMDELEKLIESQGPIIEDISRTMEAPMRELGSMVKYDICQYFTTARVMQWVGADGMTKETFDYDPSSLIPSHLPNEDPAQASKNTQAQRARIFADNLRFLIMPGTLHEMTQMVMKLGLIQLKKAGVMIDSQTIAEAWNIPNWGRLPGSTVLERWQSEQKMQIENAAMLQKLAASEGLVPPGAPPPGGGAGAPPGAPGPEGSQPEGRPATFQQPPKLESKDNGARSTISTSG